MGQAIHSIDKSVVRVTVLRKGADGTRTAVPVYDEGQAVLDQPRKKQTGMYKVLEKRTRKSGHKAIRLIDTYLALHEQSNHRRKNGWARDMRKNAAKAIRRTFND